MQGASSCKLALIRAHFILGEVEQADALLKAAGGDMLFFNDSAKRVIKGMMKNTADEKKVEKK